jgi:hypothetical protein
MSENTIDNHIEKDIQILNDPMISAQTRRHVEGELDQLKKYKENHPSDTKDPSPLELFCDENPDAKECKVFDL